MIHLRVFQKLFLLLLLLIKTLDHFISMCNKDCSCLCWKVLFLFIANNIFFFIKNDFSFFSSFYKAKEELFKELSFQASLYSDLPLLASDLPYCSWWAYGKVDGCFFSIIITTSRGIFDFFFADSIYILMKLLLYKPADSFSTSLRSSESPLGYGG